MAEDYFALIFIVNERLAAWITDPESTIDWLKEAKKGIYLDSRKFKTELDAVQK